MMGFDPNKAHTDMMEALKSIKADVNMNLLPAYRQIAGLAAVVEELNEWLCKGGYPPAAWDPFSKTPQA